jgi:hypothetical protein
MYTGTVISDLMEMVARAEDHAQDRRMADEWEGDDQPPASHFAYPPADSQPMTIGVM